MMPRSLIKTQAGHADIENECLKLRLRARRMFPSYTVLICYITSTLAIGNFPAVSAWASWIDKVIGIGRAVR